MTGNEPVPVVNSTRMARQIARLSDKLLLDSQDRKNASAGLLVEMGRRAGASTGLKGLLPK